MDLEKQLTELSAELKAAVAKRDEEIANSGKAHAETKDAVTKIAEQMKAMQTQLDAVDAKMQVRNTEPTQRKSIGDMFVESDKFKEAQQKDFSGRGSINTYFNASAFPREQKTNITDATLGSATSGVLVQTRFPGVLATPMQALRIRDVMPVRTLATGNAFDWVAQKTRTNVASPQVEAGAKSESTYLWEAKSDVVQTIAHYVNVSRQALADVPWLRNEIDNELIYGLKLKEEAEILAGDGTGVHLKGIITDAAAYATATYDSATLGYQYLDQLRFAKLQSRLVGLASHAPSAFVLHPTDMAKIEQLKGDDGYYIVGDPKTGVAVNYVWGLPVVESDSITAGTFLVGPFSSGVELVDRAQVTIDISFEHSTNFTSNLATILCEERIGIARKVPTAFITGSFSRSPA